MAAIFARAFRVCTRLNANFSYMRCGLCTEQPPEVKTSRLDSATLDLVRKLSLVDFDAESEIRTLESAIEFADQLLEVKVPNDVEPMYSVQENRPLFLRPDVVNVRDCRKEIMKLANKTEEEYYVSPPGTYWSGQQDGKCRLCRSF